MQFVHANVPATIICFFGGYQVMLFLLYACCDVVYTVFWVVARWFLTGPSSQLKSLLYSEL